MFKLMSRTRQLVRNVYLDLRYTGEFLGGTQQTRFAEQGATDVANSGYLETLAIFRGIVEQDDVLVDVGCGKGRALVSWLHLGLKNQLVGVELDEIVADATRRRFRRYPQVEIVTGSIVENLPRHGTLYFLFNPFSSSVMRDFKNRLESVGNDESVRVIFHGCQGVSVFRGDDRWVESELRVPELSKRKPTYLFSWSGRGELT
jgi:hypothetical protein